jgi:hypothetical protein
MRDERRQRVLENRTLRRIFGPRRDEVAGEWSELHNEEINGLYSPNSIWVIKSRRMRWHVWGRREVHTGFWWGNLREGDHLKDSGIDGRIILIWMFRTGGMDWIDLTQDMDLWRILVNAVMNLRIP